MMALTSHGSPLPVLPAPLACPPFAEGLPPDAPTWLLVVEPEH
jgi:hypothetical protein